MALTNPSPGVLPIAGSFALSKSVWALFTRPLISFNVRCNSFVSTRWTSREMGARCLRFAYFSMPLQQHLGTRRRISTDLDDLSRFLEQWNATTFVCHRSPWSNATEQEKQTVASMTEESRLFYLWKETHVETIDRLVGFARRVHVVTDSQDHFH